MVSSLFLCSRCYGKNLTQDDFDFDRDFIFTFKSCKIVKFKTVFTNK